MGLPCYCGIPEGACNICPSESQLCQAEEDGEGLWSCPSFCFHEVFCSEVCVRYTPRVSTSLETWEEYHGATQGFHLALPQKPVPN